MNTKVTAEIEPEVKREKTYTHQAIWEMVEKRMSDHYGVEIKFD